MVPLVNEVGDPSDVANKAHRNNERITARHISLQINPTIIALIIAITNNFQQEYNRARTCVHVRLHGKRPVVPRRGTDGRDQSRPAQAASIRARDGGGKGLHGCLEQQKRAMHEVVPGALPGAGQLHSLEKC
jgi:hypothetical protein